MANLNSLAKDVYQYAYPMVTMELTRRQATNVGDDATIPMRAPANRLVHARRFPGGADRDVVRYNFDTLYSFAWTDLEQEPMVLSVPASEGRYYLTPIYDMWSEIWAVPGSRTTDGRAVDFLMVPPGWSGEVPDGLDLLIAPTPTVWIINRVQCNGPGDYTACHEFQDRFGLTPLGVWQGGEPAPAKPYVHDDSVSDTIPPLDMVNALTGPEFFSLFAELVAVHPPHANDYPIVHRMRTLGLRPGEPFDVDAMSTDVRAAVEAAPAAALTELVETIESGSLGQTANGWNWAQTLGTYGTNYRLRAVVTMGGLGANLPEDAIYPNGLFDADGRPFDSTNRYLLHFAADEVPAVDAFWSLTMYDAHGFQVPNELDRFALRDRDRLTWNADGSLDLYLQHDNPGHDREANWLPAPPRSTFHPMLRLYSPTAETLATFTPPPVRRVD
ncbi:DUF1254 domain-containing protein [Gordonia sp. NPDC003376]